MSDIRCGSGATSSKNAPWKTNPHCGGCATIDWQPLCPKEYKLRVQEAAMKIVLRHKMATGFLSTLKGGLELLESPEKITEKAFSQPVTQVVERCPRCSLKYEVDIKTQIALDDIDSQIRAVVEEAVDDFLS